MTPNAHNTLFNIGDLVNIHTNVNTNKVVQRTVNIPPDVVKSVFVKIA